MQFWPPNTRTNKNKKVKQKNVFKEITTTTSLVHSK